MGISELPCKCQQAKRDCYTERGSANCETLGKNKKEEEQELVKSGKQGKESRRREIFKLRIEEDRSVSFSSS